MFIIPLAITYPDTISFSESIENHVQELKKQIKDKDNEMTLVEEQHLSVIKEKDTRITSLFQKIEVLQNDLYLKEQQKNVIVEEEQKRSSQEVAAECEKLHISIANLEKKLQMEKMVKDATIKKLEQIMNKRAPETKDNSKIKLDRLARANRQLKQQIENKDELAKTAESKHAKELEKVHKELDQANSRNNELKNVLTIKETEILELQRKLLHVRVL